MFTLGSSKSEYEPYYISDGCGDNFIYGNEATMRDLRDQLNAMFPPEPVESPAQVEAGVDDETPRYFTDSKDGTEHPYLIKDQWTCQKLWFSANELHKLYTELQAHFGHAQNSINPEQVDTSIDWAGDRWEIAVDTPINWETRRWQAMLAVLGSISRHEALHNQTARLSMEIADAIIARYRAEPKGGDA